MYPLKCHHKHVSLKLFNEVTEQTMFAVVGGFVRNIDYAKFSPRSRASVITGAIQSKLSGNVRPWPDPVQAGNGPRIIYD